MYEKEIKGLLARARRYIRSARLLIEDKDYESTVSRAYYAMFYVAEAALLAEGLSFSSHKAVISAFGEHFIKKGIFKKDLSKAIVRAFEKRQVSDYEASFIVTEKDAAGVLNDAESFVATLSEYLKGRGCL